MKKKLFTFGRERELENTACFIGNENKAKPLLDLIDAIHDYLDDKVDISYVEDFVEAAVVDGYSGVWESATTWLNRLGQVDANILKLWVKLAQHDTAKVRFRVACNLDNISPMVSKEVAGLLLNDRSKKVREMAEERLEDSTGLEQ